MDKEYFLDKGILYLEGILTREVAVETIRLLHLLEESHYHEEIRIYVALENAQLPAALMLGDVIRNMKTKVKTYAISYLVGYSSFVFLAGHERVALAHSVINFPRFDFSIEGNKIELINFNNYTDKVKKNMRDTYIECTGQEPFEEFLTEDRFMKAQEMLEKNVATEVIGG